MVFLLNFLIGVFINSTFTVDMVVLGFVAENDEWKLLRRTRCFATEFAQAPTAVFNAVNQEVYCI